LEQLDRPTANLTLPTPQQQQAVVDATTTQSNHSNKSSDDEEDEEDDAFLKALSLVHVSQHNSAVVSQQLYDIALSHQCYLINALLAIGFAMESYHSLIARCVYTMARRRASSVLQVSHPALDKALRQGGVHELRKQLCPGLFTTPTLVVPAAPERKSPVNDASYPIAFFTSFADGKYETQSSGRSVLPPLHCSAVFPLRSSVTHAK